MNISDFVNTLNLLITLISIIKKYEESSKKRVKLKYEEFWKAYDYFEDFKDYHITKSTIKITIYNTKNKILKLKYHNLYFNDDFIYPLNNDENKNFTFELDSEDSASFLYDLELIRNFLKHYKDRIDINKELEFGFNDTLDRYYRIKLDKKIIDIIDMRDQDLIEETIVENK